MTKLLVFIATILFCKVTVTNVNKNKSEVIIKGIQAEFQLAEINLFRNLSFTCPFIILGLSSEELKNNI